ncbi:MAG: hypothetical protein FD146_1780 [Anaerolineaceae bacterium]|nr:MAG: hypothetical protein FD146_1780 [Anaerolineaceae bacterium]
MSLESITIIRLCGIAGILGALITGMGDLLYHHIPGSKQTLAERMSSLPQKRLVTAGILGLIGSWLYFFGAFHLYYAFLPLGNNFALAVSLSFALVAICYGVGHASYYAIGSSAKVARENQLDIESAGKTGEALFSKLVLITYAPVAIAMLLMLYGIVSGRSAYPIWMVVFLPIVPYLLRVPVLKILRGRAHELVRDSYDNFVLLVFFLMSTIVLWIK